MLRLLAGAGGRSVRFELFQKLRDSSQPIVNEIDLSLTAPSQTRQWFKRLGCGYRYHYMLRCR